MSAGFKSRPAKNGFTLPYANLDSTRVTREWRNIKVQDLQEDDIVSGMGKVRMAVLPTCDGQVTVCAGFPDDKFYFIDVDTEVYAFVEKES